MEKDTHSTIVAKDSATVAARLSRLPIIHIGYPKCGSSSLQLNLFFENPQINYLSSNRPASLGTAFQRSLETPRFYQAIHSANSIYDPAVLRETWHRHFEAAFTTDQTNLLSAEGFTANLVDPEEVANRLRTVIPAARILIVVRNQIDLLRSLYDMHPYRLWRDDRHVIPSTTWLTDILSDRNQSIAGGLWYARVIGTYHRLFGPENVTTFLFERLFKEESEMRRLAAFLEVNADETLRRLQQRPQNQASDHSLARLGRRVLGPIHASWLLPYKWIKTVNALGARVYRPKRTEFSPQQQAELRAAYGADNAVTARLIGEDLGAYGYPMA